MAIDESSVAFKVVQKIQKVTDLPNCPHRGLRIWQKMVPRLELELGLELVLGLRLRLRWLTKN